MYGVDDVTVSDNDGNNEHAVLKVVTIGAMKLERVWSPVPKKNFDGDTQSSKEIF